MRVDAHTHVTPDEIDFLRSNEVACIVNGASPEEWTRNLEWERHPLIFASYGVHPWNAGQFNPAVLKDFCPAIVGEIGMDCVWCEVDLSVQRDCFLQQLELAAQWGARVMLHTKGCEREILELIRNVPLTYCVHWYADLAYLKGYLDADCYFTVPIMLRDDATMREIIRHIPAERLMPESDGIGAVAWALGRPVSRCEYLSLLDQCADWVADIRGEDAVWMQTQMEENFRRFVQGK